MDTNFTLILSTFFFTSILFNLPSMTLSDDVCPYPCYPPPTGTGTGTGTPTVTTPPSTPSQSGYYPPPGYYPSPTGNLPYSPPNFGNNFPVPPPPDPILPYFPFYYRKPPHQTDGSSATSLPRSFVMFSMANILAFLLIFLGVCY